MSRPPWKEPGHQCSLLAGDGPPCNACKAYFKVQQAARKLVTQGIRAAWRQKRVCTDGDMGALLDGWMQDDMRPAFEIADRSNGRITVETEEQLRSGLIAVAWALEHPPAVGIGGVTPIYDRTRTVRRYIASGAAQFNGKLAHDEIAVEVEPMCAEFEGTVRVVSIYGYKGEEIIALSLDDPQFVRIGDTFIAIVRIVRDAGDRVVPVMTRAGRAAGRIYNERNDRLPPLRFVGDYARDDAQNTIELQRALSAPSPTTMPLPE